VEKAKFDSVLVEGKLTDGSGAAFQVVEQGTVDNCGYKIGEIVQRYGREWEVTKISTQRIKRF